MDLFERTCSTIRNNRLLRQNDRFWDLVRPIYDRLLILLFGRNGLERTINGTDSLRLMPSLRWTSVIYEPDVWPLIMQEIHRDDRVADIGAYIGLYTVAIAKRLESTGKVYAFEPEPNNFLKLKAHIHMNRVTEKVELFNAAVTSCDRMVPFIVGRRDQSYVAAPQTNSVKLVQSVCLDSVFAKKELDIIKIDVEGYEEEVLRGGLNLLNDRCRSPRMIFIEVHPYAWHIIGTTSDSLILLLEECGYRTLGIDLHPVKQINAYGNIIASKIHQ